MLGREVHWPQDISFPCASRDDDFPDEVTYVDELTSNLDKVQRLARSHLKKAQVHQKRDYDLRLHTNSFNLGDTVLIIDTTQSKGKSPKLQTLWKGPFVITKKLGPVLFRVENNKKSLVLHHDRLKAYEGETLPHWVNRLRNTSHEPEQSPGVQTQPVTQAPSIDKQTETDALPRNSRNIEVPRVRPRRRKSMSDVDAPQENLQSMPPYQVKTSRGRTSRAPERYGIQYP